MSLCVPEWDGSGGVLGSVVPSNSAFHGNGKVEFVSSRKSHYSEVPDQDAVEVGWNDNEHIDMQGHNGKSPKVQWQYISGRGNGDDGVTPSKPKSEEAVPVAIENADDEMVSWLQYPLDASLERSYCSEFFGELPPSNTQLMKESFGYKPAVRSSLPVNDDRAAIAEAAMMMGAGRAAGLLPQTGVEAFSKVRTLQSPQQQTRWPQNGSNSALKSNPMLPPRRQPIAPSQSAPGTRPGNANFSHFSFYPASAKTNSRSLAVPNVAQPKRPMAEASTSTGSCIADSTSGSRQEVHVQVGGEQCNGFESSRLQGASPKHGDCVAPGGDCKSVTPADQEMCRQSGVTRDASEKGASCVTQQPDVQEPTITCSSGGYEISAERAKEAATSTKRKSSEKEDAECQSEDGEGESVDTKKPLTVRGSTAKRSRAAEVHNQSERRRRDRINEKMRALQELIPNSNKTDKASMLDEAIEYLKMLQTQLQMMSMRTGMTLPPMVVPPGLQQHMHMPQMGAMPSMGMGMGMMPMGLPMGMMDMGVSGPGRAGMLMPSHAGPSMNMASLSTVVDMHDLRYQAAGNDSMDPYTAYLARQHQPMQMNQPLGMDKYNAYMLQQHQQHQQQLFPQPQQHQQHHIHQQGPHMNGGPPL